MSLAYSNAAAPAAPVAEIVEGVSAQPASTTVAAVQLIVLNRDRDTHVYQWDVFASVDLGRA